MSEETVREEHMNCELRVRGNLRLNRLDDDEDSGEHQVDHDEDPEIHHRHVELVRSLRTIAE